MEVMLTYGESKVAEVARTDAVDTGDDDAVDRGAGQLGGSTRGQLAAQHLDLVVQ